MEDQRRQPHPKRRALNIIWTAAEDYHFTPSFTAFWQDGEPDFYLNSIIGYVHKWYDPAVIGGLFETLRHCLFRETLEGLLWVALENCAYEREAPQRPILSELRREHAEAFLLQEQSWSRQQWMAQNSLVYALQAARCRLILGQSPGLANPWERKLFEELQYDASWTSQEIADWTLEIFQQYFHIHTASGRPALPARLWRALGTCWRHFLLKRMPSRFVRTDTLLGSPADARQAASTAGRLLDLRHNPARSRQSDLKYIQGCFGEPLYSEEENRRIQQESCTDTHEHCHLYFTKGQLSAAPDPDPLVENAKDDAREQARKNKEHFHSRRRFYQTSIVRLREQIQNALLVYPQPLCLRSRSGTLFSSQVWRGIYLDDPYVFQDTIEEPAPNFSVDLMLDASASRLESQEVIAAQGYVIARSLRLCQIPVQVFSFLTIRGYTVMRLFSGYEDTDTLPNIFQYSAAGWNRDGLALRGARQLMDTSRARNRLLIVLTDASPNDDRRIPANPAGGRLLSQDYSGPAGVQDTRANVRQLRKDGIHVCAILTGSDGDTAAAQEIYGQEFVRIETMEHFSQAAGNLIQRQIALLRT